MPTGFPDYYGGLTLPVTVQEGGTGKTTTTTNALLLGAGTSPLVETNVGAAYQVLQVPAAGGAPAFQAPVLGNGNFVLDTTGKLTKYAGVTLAGVGQPSIIYSLDDLGDTDAYAAVNLVTGLTAGHYTVLVNCLVSNSSGGADSVGVAFTWTQNGVSFSRTAVTVAQGGNGTAMDFATFELHCDTGTAIQLTVVPVLGAGDYYNLCIRIEHH